MRLGSTRFVRLIPFFLAAASLAGCADSKTTGPDGGDGSVADAAPGDGSPGDGSVPDAAPLCPNGHVDTGEACDDGNMVDGDGCDSDCTFSALCGDGRMDAGEECDDGNNKSGDGCDGLCRTEGCGNGRLDAGEVCDGTPGCNGTCTAVTTCGNGDASDPGEQCDDGNTASWDGCSAACETEKSVAISNLEFATTPPAGCDVNRDGVGDNRLGEIISSLAKGLIQQVITDQLSMPPFIVLSVLGAKDASFASDPNVRIAWLSGTDGDSSSANDFDGTGTVRVDTNTVNGNVPILSFAGSIASRVANAGPEDVTLPFLGGQSLGLKRASLVASTFTVTTDVPPRYSFAPKAGHLCGTLPASTVGAIPNFLGLAGSMLPGGASLPTNSCDATAVPDNQVTMADVFTGGASATLGPIALPVINGRQPDVDFDGDGLESFELASGSNCQPVIIACIDGDGTRIPGHACVNDPKIADGWSAAFDLTAANVTLVP